jgi:hypothetical protein
MKSSGMFGRSPISLRSTILVTPVRATRPHDTADGAREEMLNELQPF